MDTHYDDRIGRGDLPASRYDVIVIGAGAAGLTAGMYLGRARQKTLILDHATVGGQMILTYAVANYPGVLEASGASIVHTMRQQAEAVGCTIMGNADILRVDLAGDSKIVEVDDEGTPCSPRIRQRWLRRRRTLATRTRHP